MHIIVHARQDQLGRVFKGIAAQGAVALYLLHPFQIDDGRHADQQIHMAGDIHSAGHDPAVQALIKQQIGVFIERFPGGQGAWRIAVLRGLFFIVNIKTPPARAFFPIFLKQALQLRKQIALGAEMGQPPAFGLGLSAETLHLRAFIAVKTIALDHGGLDAVLLEHVCKRIFGYAGAGPGGAGDGNDRMFA